MQRISITNPQNIIDGTAKKYYFKLRNTGGPKGDKGDKGDTGATGPQGPQGNAATVSVGSTTTLPVGYDATVTNAGSIYNAVLDFGIPQGPQGPQGAKGDKGDTGAKGDTGPRGPQGERGTNATVYIGTTTTLNPGSQATVYNSGTDSNAVLNFGIPRGEKGETGATGATGATGPAGQDGQNFTPTIVAELPATGDESKLYLTPKAHTTSTATGNPITASVTEQAGQIESFQLDGDTFQQTYTGKNLLGLPASFAETASNTTTTTSNGLTTISSSGTTRTYPHWCELVVSYPAGTYTFSISKALDYDIFIRLYQDSSTYPETLTIRAGSTESTKTTTYQIVKMVGLIALPLGSTYSESFNAQVEAGSSATAFEPYVGGQASPNQDYPQAIQTVTGEQTVEVRGKNLLSDELQASITYSGTTCIINGSTWTVKKSGNGGISLNPRTDFLPVSIPAGTTVAFSSYPVSGTVTESSVYYQIRCYWYDKDKNLLGNTPTATTSQNIMSQVRTTTYTPNTDVAYIKLGDYIPSSTGTTEGVELHLQLELGSTPTAYAPYSKHAYPINLGKNLFNKDSYQVIDAYFNTSTTTITSNVSNRTLYIPCEPNTTYTVSKRAGAVFNVGYTDSLPAIGTSVYEIQGGSTLSSQTLTTGANAKYLVCRFYQTVQDTITQAQMAASIQIEKGSVATSYAPYKTPIELCKLSAYYADYIYKDGDDWKIRKMVGKYTFNGQENWAFDTERTPRFYLSSGGLATLGINAAAPPNSTTMPVGLTNRFVAKTFTSFYSNRESDGFAMSTSGQNFQIGDKNWTQRTQAEAAANGLIWYYALATGYATDTVITDQTLIAQLEAIRTASLENGANTITNTATGSNLAGDMEIGYYGYNPTNRYDKFIWLDINDNYEQIGE